MTAKFRVVIGGSCNSVVSTTNLIRLSGSHCFQKIRLGENLEFCAELPIDDGDLNDHSQVTRYDDAMTRFSLCARLFGHPVRPVSASMGERLRDLASEDFSARLTDSVRVAVRNSIASHLSEGRSVPIIRNCQKGVLTPSAHGR